jgi:hypothetical protein
MLHSTVGLGDETANGPRTIDAGLNESPHDAKSKTAPQ